MSIHILMMKVHVYVLYRRELFLLSNKSYVVVVQ